MVELFPEGFEERDLSDGVELAAYTDAGGEERLWAAFGTVTAANVDAGWEQRWRDFHRPVRIGRVWIGPPWEEPPGDAIAVVIDPGRAFGTGGARDDSALPRAPGRARAGQPRRRRLRLGRARRRSRPARLRARARARPRRHRH